MTTTTTFPPHGRLMTKLTALGPICASSSHQKVISFF